MLHLHEEIYLFDLFFFYKNESKEQVLEFVKNNNSYAHDTTEVVDTLFNKIKKGKYVSHNSTCIIYIKDFEDTSYCYGTITHEVFHLVHNIMKSRGLKLTDSSEEAYAYLIGFVNRTIFDHIFKSFKEDKIDTGENVSIEKLSVPNNNDIIIEYANRDFVIGDTVVAQRDEINIKKGDTYTLVDENNDCFVLLHTESKDVIPYAKEYIKEAFALSLYINK